MSGFTSLFATTFVLMAGYGSIYALFAVIRETFGFTAWEIGLIGGSGFAAGFVAQVGLSRFADRGHTPVMFRVGLACSGVGSLGMAWSESIEGFIVSRMLLGLGSGAFLPAVRRVLIASQPDQAGERLGWMASLEMGGFMTGPILASLIHAQFGLQTTFGFLALGLLILAPFALRTPIPTTQSARDPRAIRVLLALPAVRGVLLASLAFYLTVGLFEATWAVLLSDRGASQFFIGATLSVFGLPMLFLPPWAGRLAQRHGALRVAACGIAVAIPCMALYGVVESLIGLAVIVILHSVADAFTMPSLQLGIGRASPPEHLASGQGLLGATGQFMAASTALVGGALYDAGGPIWLFTLGSFTMVPLLVAAVTVGRSLLRA
ncbi:MFS transporter [Myxococcota bacterium]|nr:MFS transporter [Myxococcota bacterium]